MYDDMVYAGIDLAAKPENPSGVCIFKEGRLKCLTLYDDNAIIGMALKIMPDVIAIDAPLTLPKGRCCFNDSCCGTRKIRECDRMLISMGYRVFPPGFSFMKQLTIRGKSLREKLESEGLKVIEVHPRTTMRILGIDGKEEFKGMASSMHEIDACAAAIAAMLYHQGKFRAIGDEEGVIIIPPNRMNSLFTFLQGLSSSRQESF
jgi:hypothetical protein